MNSFLTKFLLLFLISFSGFCQSNWFDNYSIGVNVSQWAKDEVELGLQFELSKNYFSRNKWNLNSGLLMKIDYLPIPLFYNKNYGKSKGADLRIQFPQLILGAEYKFSESFSIRPKLLGGLSFLYANGKYENSQSSLESPRIKSFNTLFTTNIGLDLNYYFNHDSGLEFSFLSRLTHAPTPNSIGILYLRRLK